MPDRAPPHRVVVTLPDRAPEAPGRTVAPGVPPGPVERIAVVRALPGVGDLLCAVPALRAVRAAHPDARVTLVGLPEASWFVERFADLVDDLLVVVGVEGLPEVAPDADAATGFHARARSRRFDLALQLHGSGVATNPLTTLLGARHQVTACLPGEWRPPGTTVAYPEDVHEVERLLAVTCAAGIPDAGTDVTFPLRPADRAAAEALLADAGLPAGVPYGCIHPGASRPANRWNPSGYAAVGDRLAAAGLTVVLTGTAGERDVVAEVARRGAAPSVDLSGRTDVGTLAALFASARMVVSNDTGAAHVAAAVRVPSVVVFAPDGDPVRWAPRDGGRHRAVLPAPVARPGAGRPATVPARPGAARRAAAPARVPAGSPDTLPAASGRTAPRPAASRPGAGRPAPAPAWPSVDAVLAAVEHQLAIGQTARSTPRATLSPPPASSAPSVRELLR